MNKISKVGLTGIALGLSVIFIGSFFSKKAPVSISVKDSNYLIPSTVISQIITQSLLPKAELNKKSSVQESDLTEQMIKSRTLMVMKYLQSTGGGNWYTNYSKEFSAPATGELFTAQTKHMTDKTLGYYYIHRPLNSAQDILAFQCLAKDSKAKSPTMDGFCGIANYQAFLFTKEQRYYTTFMKWANHFVERQNDGKWEWSIDVPARGIKAPWISGLSQSVGISLLLRAYQSTHDEKYLNAATKAMKWLALPISKDGVAMYTDEGTWFEEYPNKADPSHVLNGHIWALFGIWDYYRVTGDPKAKELFDNGIKVIKATINHYDTGFWVVYAASNNVDYIKGNYMAFMIQQMKVLYSITGDEFFNTYSKKWNTYQTTSSLFIHIVVNSFMSSEYNKADAVS